MDESRTDAVSEWFKVQSWKDCVEQSTGSSNLPRSARINKRLKPFSATTSPLRLVTKKPPKVEHRAQTSTKVQHVCGGFLKPSDVARLLGVSVQTINRWCRAGKLPATPQRFGQRQTYLISRAIVDAVQNGAMTPQRTGPAPKEVLEHRPIVPRWIRAMQKGIITGKPFSPLTIEDYQRSIEGFLARHPKLDFQSAQLEMMRCPTEQYGKRFKMHKAFVCFAKYLEAQGMTNEALINDLKRLRPKRHLPPKRHAINDAELAKLLGVCKDIQDRLIMVLLATTGLRVSEACNLKLCEIDPIQGFLVVNLGKGNKTRRLGVGDSLMGLIQDYVSTHPHDKAKGYLLINQDGKPQTRHGLRQTLKRLGNKAGVKVTPHSLRRYFATSNLLKGRPLPLVQRAMGHADISTTRAYCQDTEQQLIDAMRGWG